MTVQTDVPEEPSSAKGSKGRGPLSISSNVVATVLQVVFNGVVLFILYRYLYRRLGVEQIGTWSLVLATTSISRIGDLGLSAGVVRYVAQALGQEDRRRAADVIQTVVLTIGLCAGVLLLAGAPLFVRGLQHVLTGQRLAEALSILPYALGSLWVLLVVGVLSGGLEGCMRMDLRSVLMVGASVVYLGLTILLVPTMGLRGVALAQFIQSLGLMVTMWWVLRRQLKELPWLPWRWRYSVIRGMINYGVSFQFITFLSMLFDPVVKILINYFGGIGLVGYYEMVNKLIFQGRTIIVEAVRVIVPAVAAINEQDANKNLRLFEVTYRITFFVSTVFFGSVGLSITLINLLWIGEYSSTFVMMALMLNFGWFINTLMVPAYFSNLGTGELRQNLLCHLLLAVATPILGGSMGTIWGGMGVVAGISLGLSFQAIYLLVFYAESKSIKLRTLLLPEGMSLVLIGALLFPLTINALWSGFPSLVWHTFIVLLGLCVYGLIAWFNPMRTVILAKWIRV